MRWMFARMWSMRYADASMNRAAAGEGMVSLVEQTQLRFLAAPQQHQVFALDRQSGEVAWRFTAGGRVSLPPSLHDGLALFGAHDGYVYAVRTADGTLAWRRRAAPSDRRIMAYGQLESAWPVTSVLMHGGIAYAAAGRAVDADGGAVVHAMVPGTCEANSPISACFQGEFTLDMELGYGKTRIVVRGGLGCQGRACAENRQNRSRWYDIIETGSWPTMNKKEVSTSKFRIRRHAVGVPARRGTDQVRPAFHLG